MQDILNTIGGFIGGILSNPIVQLGFQFLALYGVILWLAASYWAYRDMQLRSDNPVLPYLAAALIVLFTPVLFIFGVLVYRVVRPQEKIAEVYERNLAEEALLAEVEAIHTCPGCNRRIHDEWIICPICRTRLNRVCPTCSRLVGLDWSLCAWCGRDFERVDRPAFEPAAAAPARIVAQATAPSIPAAAPVREPLWSASPPQPPVPGAARSGKAKTSGNQPKP
jgi:RNA polymerase subunit RPABC4/transcription elongation factor Spt4